MQIFFCDLQWLPSPRGKVLSKTLLIMKLTIILLFALCIQVSARVYSQQISLSVKNSTLKQVFSQIKKQTGYSFLWDEGVLKKARPVSFTIKDASIDDVMSECLRDQSLTYTIDKQLIVVKAASVETGIHDVNPVPLPPADISLSGRVTNTNKEPLEGVSVTVKGTQTGTTTNADGRFQLSVPSVNSVELVFSFVGYAAQTVKAGNRTMFDIILEEAVADLSDIVVVGYGTQKKVNLTGAVAQIGGEKLGNRSVTNVSQALQGQMANLNIASASGGAPGAAPSINIRGYTGLGTSAAPLVVIDGIQGGNLNGININDVESISVLKDAASAAIYGSSAPYGVILVTTKSGKGKKPSITYNNNFGFAQPINLPKTMNSLDFANFMNEASDNSGAAHLVPDEQLQRIKDYLNGTFTDETIANPTPGVDDWLGGNANHDWYKLLFKNYAFDQQHNIGVSGSINKTMYYVGLGFVQQNGVLKDLDDNFRRFNVRTNLHTSITSWLTLNMRSAFSREQKDELNTAGYASWFGNIMHTISRTKPWDPVTYPNGTINPTFLLFKEGGRSLETIDNAVLTGEFAIHPMEGWDITANYTFDGTYLRASQHLKTLYNNAFPSGNSMPWIGAPNSFTRSQYFGQHHTINAYTSYEKQWGKHYFKGLVGYTQELYDDLTLSAGNQFLYSDDLPVLTLAYGATPTVKDAGTQLAVRGGFGRINYNFEERYLLELNGRYDGTSKFMKDVRYKFYPGISVAWVVSKEAFWNPLASVISSFKLRGSYGRLGDQSFTSNVYPFYPALSVKPPTASNYLFNNGQQSYVSNPSLVNPALSWIVVSTLDFGADISFLSNRLSFNFDWYRRSMDNFVGPAQALPALLGTGAPQTNSAAMKTEGIEFTVGWQERKGKWAYGINVVLSDYKGVVTKYPNPNKLTTTWYEGQRIGEIWGYETVGLFQSEAEIASAPSQSRLYSRWTPGDVRYADLNKDNQIDWGNNTLDNPGDMKVIGNTTPRYSFGINANVQYEGFDLSLFVQGVGKRDAAPSPTSHISNYFWGITGDPAQSTGFVQQYDRWSEINSNGYYPKFYFTTAEMNKNKQTQTRYLLDASYLRIKNIQLGYTLPNQLLAKIKSQKIRLFVNVENLATVTKFIKTMDPEFSNTQGFALGPDGKVYPLQRIWACGLNVTF